MSYVRFSIIGSDKTISGEAHGSMTDAMVASLSAEPETSQEFETALTRYVNPSGEPPPFAFFKTGEDLEPYDAGIVVIDLTARVVAIDSTYSRPGRSGDVIIKGFADFGLDIADLPEAPPECADDPLIAGRELHCSHPSTDQASDGPRYADVAVPYRLPDDWVFVHSIPEYEGVCRSRRKERSQHKPLDAREVLYGKEISTFIAREVLSALKEAGGAQNAGVAAMDAELALQHGKAAPSEADQSTPLAAAAQNQQDLPQNDSDEHLFTEIHAKWLTTARADLEGKTPRENLLAKKDFIDFELHARQLQWSFTGACPTPLSEASHAYRSAGFGIHECVVYYDLIRYLLGESFRRCREEKDVSVSDEAARLERLKAAWLSAARDEFMGKAPSFIIDYERKRIPFAIPAMEAIVDEDCPVCQALAEDFDTPTFWHLDGSHMDYLFEFSFFKTREEWEAEQRRWEEFNREFEQDWRAGKSSDIGATDADGERERIN